MTKQPTTLAELKELSEKTGIAIHELQREYGIYEFTFSSCLEARENYKHTSDPLFGSKDDNLKPETVAYHKAWEQISLEECPDVTKLDFQQSLDFLQVCFPKGPQLIALIGTLEKNINGNVAKISEFFKQGYNNTFYEFSKCPIRELAGRLIESINKHYRNEMGKTWKQEKLISLYQEMLDYGFSKVRPYPEAFDELSEKISKTASTISELHELQFANSKIDRWKKLLPKTKMEDILPTLKDFLVTMHQADQNRHKTPNEVWNMLSVLFHRVANDGENRSLLDLGRKFFPKEDGATRTVYDWFYVPANEQILNKKLAKNPRLSEFASLFSEACMKSAIAEKITARWIKATEQALNKPIPNFGKLYSSAHDSLKKTVLNKWNSWSLLQLDGVETWEELTEFNYGGFIPIPQDRFSRSYSINSPNRSSFSTFIVFLERLITTAPDLENQLMILGIIVQKSKDLRSCHNFDLLLPEVTTLTQRIIAADNVPVEKLWLMYEKVKEISTRDQTEAMELIADTIIKKDPSGIQRVFTDAQDNQRLRSKYLKLNVEYAMN